MVPYQRLRVLSAAKSPTGCSAEQQRHGARPPRAPARPRSRPLDGGSDSGKTRHYGAAHELCRPFVGRSSAPFPHEVNIITIIGL